MAYSKRAKRKAKKRRTCRAHEAVMEVIHAPRREPAEDPRIVVLNARARHFGPDLDAASVMLADPAGQAIHLGARDADEAAGLWNVFARYDAADETYFRRIIGRHRFANVARLDMLPERFETRADDRPDLRSDDERDRDAVNAWMHWQGALQSLDAHEASLVIRASRQTCGALVICGQISATGRAFVAAMRALRGVVDRR